MMRHRARLLALLCTALLGCATGRNYPDARGPRYAGSAPAAATADSLRIVSFNLHFAERIDAAIGLLREHPQLRDADILALQEMDEAGTQRLAEALGMHWVYYPATVHPHHERNFGNAVLARRPILNDHKLVLPHLGRFRKTQRVAVAGEIEFGGSIVRIYSVHLETALEMGPESRREQAQAIVEDARGARGPVIVAGDLNSQGAGSAFTTAGFGWPTRGLPATTSLFHWDHIFLKGLALRTPASRGVAGDARDASDHKPVWAVVVVNTTAD
jgi:endonuclease/exonuclease/phosphatase family metal-dependent hydrolase